MPRFLGIDPRAPVRGALAAAVADRVGPDGDLLRQIIVEVLQDKDVAVSPTTPAGGASLLEGGCTIVADLQRLAIDYCIRKNVESRSRLDRQRQFLTRDRATSLYATYFGDEMAQREPVARLHGAW